MESSVGVQSSLNCLVSQISVAHPHHCSHSETPRSRTSLAPVGPRRRIARRRP